MTGLIRFLMSSSILSVPSGEQNALLSRLMEEEIPYDHLHTDGEGRCTLRVYRSDRDRVLALSPHVRVVREEGLTPLILRYRRRWGLMLGTLMAVLLCHLSTQVIWSMEIVGNERIGDLEILSALEDAGCHVGSYIPRLDLWQVGGDVKRVVAGISFLAVNLDGTHARIEIREEEEKQIESLDGPPSHLVATCDGQIVRTEVFSGQARVKVHDVVKKGDLLVSGVVNTKVRPDQTFRLERSVGRVYAKTRREISVFVPASFTETVEERGQAVEKWLIFFGYRQKVLKKGGNLPPKYGIISEKVQWVLFGTLPLPIWSETSYLAVPSERRVTLAGEALRDKASEVLWDRVREELEHAEFTSYEILEEMGKDGITLTLVAQCVEEIGCEVPILTVP